jgi:ribosomal protein RSM22 (predicted rRNA methylase)
LFFTLADLVKVAYPLGELGTLGRIPTDPGPTGAPLRILDVGAGFGAQTLGLLLALDRPERAGRPLTIRAVDRDTKALEVFQQLLEQCRGEMGIGQRTSLETAVQDLARSDLDISGPFDLVLVGNVLNELPEQRRFTLLTRLLSTLDPAGHLIALEPALRETARDLHRVRDRLLEAGAARVLAPCTRSGPCPMLASENDWCHERRHWQPPPGIRALARSTGLRRRDLKWSYLILAPPLRGESAPPSHPAVWRTVSDPLPSKGKLELFLCSELGRLRALRLNRHRSVTNRPIQRLRRGWLADIKGSTADGRILRVNRDTEVLAEDPAVGRRT